MARATVPVTILGAFPAVGSPATVDTGTVAWVTDGDTFMLESGERIRVAGIDAPETQEGQAKCAREIALGKRAAARARSLLEGRSVGLVRVGRSYRRTVAQVTLGGRDLGGVMIAQGIARPWPHHAPKPDWCGDADGTSRRR